MKILRINTSASHGGAALSAWNIQQAVDKFGVDTIMLSARGQRADKNLISLSETSSRRYINALAYRIFGLEGFANDSLWQPILSRFGEFDLIHLHNVHGYYMPMRVLEKILSKPCVWTLHDFWITTGGPGSPLPKLHNRSRLEQLFPFANLRYPAEWIDRSKQRRQKLSSLLNQFNPSLVAVSQAMADRLISMGLSANRLSVIHHGLFDNERAPSPVDRREARQRKGWPLDKHIFTFCAAQVDNPSKGCGLFLDALSTLLEPNSWVAYVIGEKTDVARRKVQDLSLNVQFVGGVSDLEIKEYFRACDTYVTPSLDETYGRTVVEALAEGANVVCSDLPVLREVSSERAIFFPPSDHIALRRALERLLIEDTTSSRQDSANVIRHKFSREVMAQSYIELYREEIKNKFNVFSDSAGQSKNI